MNIAMIGKQERGVSGASAHVFELSKGLTEMGNNVTNIPRLESPASTLHYLYRLSRRFDIVHVHTFLPSPVIASLVTSRMFEQKVVLTVHAFAPPGWYHDLAARFVMRESIKNFQGVICVSEYIRGKMATFVRNRGPRLVTIYNGVDTSRFNPSLDARYLRKRLGVEGKKVILYVGRLVAYKGVTYLLEALSKLPQDIRDDAMLLVCGRGKMRQNLEEMVSRLKLTSNVIFAGFVQDEELPYYYAASDIVVVPSMYEPMGIVLLEAMSMKKPVIASKTGGIPEIISDKDNGLLVPPGDPEALARAIESVCSDRNLAETLGENGHKNVETNFTWERMVNDTLKLYLKIL